MDALSAARAHMTGNECAGVEATQHCKCVRVALCILGVCFKQGENQVTTRQLGEKQLPATYNKN